MINKIILSLFLLSSFKLYAQEININDCLLLSLDYGNGKGADDFPKTCHSLITPLTTKQTRVETENYKVWAYKNLFYVSKRNEKTSLFELFLNAGENTTLQKIKAIAIDEKNKELAIYDETSQSIKTFSLEVTGNVAPYREIKTEETKGVTELLVLAEKDLILALKAESGEALFFSRKANIHALPQNRSLKVVHQVKDLSIEISIESVDLEKELVILRSAGESKVNLALP